MYFPRECLLFTNSPSRADANSRDCDIARYLEKDAIGVKAFFAALPKSVAENILAAWRKILDNRKM